jgi:hypothetical protein
MSARMSVSVGAVGAVEAVSGFSWESPYEGVNPKQGSLRPLRPEGVPQGSTS